MRNKKEVKVRVSYNFKGELKDIVDFDYNDIKVKEKLINDCSSILEEEVRVDNIINVKYISPFKYDNSDEYFANLIVTIKLEELRVIEMKKEKIDMRNIQRRKKVLTEREEANIKKWNKRIENSYNTEILLNNLIPYFESVGKNFCKYGDKESFENDLNYYKKLRNDFLHKKEIIKDLIEEYHYTYSNLTETTFEFKYYDFFELQMKAIEIARNLQPKIVEYCKSTKAGW